MRRLEHEDEEKFWEAWIKDDAIFCYRFGKIGTTGQTRIKRHASREEAEADLEENIQRKLKEGFEEKSGDAEEEEEDAAEEEEEEEEEEKEDGDDDEAEEEEEAPKAKKKPAAAAKDDEEEDEEEEEEEEDEEEEDDEDEAPKAKKKKPAAAAHHPPPPPPEPSKPKLPARTRAKAHAIAPEQISAAKNALEALHAGLGGRSWKVRKLARRARQSLERVAGVDPSKHGFGDAFDALMNDVTAEKKRLPLEVATQLLLELDPAVFVRVVKHWKGGGPAKDAIGVLQTSVAAIDDADVALHVGAAFAERRLDAPSWRKRFGHVKPVLEEALKKKGSTLAKYLKSLDTGEDSVLASHVEEAAR
jgi:predicted DNA-binding WGR domain protein